MILDAVYQRKEFQGLVNNLVPDLKFDVRGIEVQSKTFISAMLLGRSSKIDLHVLEILVSKGVENRVSITRDAFSLLKNHGIYNALVVFRTERSDQWRISLMTSTAIYEDGKSSLKLSNPKRNSYVLGPNAKTKTPSKLLVSSGQVGSLDELRDRFSIEVVNKEFFDDIALLYHELVGEHSINQSSGMTQEGILKLPEKIEVEAAKQQFAVRLIGRLVFCWFLRQKVSTKGVPLLPDKFFIVEANNKEFYHETLEPLFFETLNKPFSERDEKFNKEPYMSVPYLNGGLFYPKFGHGGDYYSVELGGLKKLSIPNRWFTELFDLLNRFNFTVDENSSFDTDLSVDPEMLGRIFENLLAEINPDTGEAARKSTGSFYTPRAVVDYMVDRTIINFLSNRTRIDLEKLEALVSYDQQDDDRHPLSEDEKREIAVSLQNFRVLDPACGSGAFPIGILQKVVWIQQQIDPIAEIWLEQQLSGLTVELQRHLKNQIENENFDYLRKLGVIRESLFGVDIQPIATEMSRLRCFLTLIVEEDVRDDVENRGIQPLPNLEFKFITANSLLDLSEEDEKSSNYPSMFDDSGLLKELKEMRDRYFTSTGKSRSRMMDSFTKIQKEMKSSLDTIQFGVTSKAFRKLAEWDPFGVDGVDWFDPEWMFGVSKFDAIICNPPYVGEKGHKEIFREIKSSGLGQFYIGKMDLFYFFFHLGLNLAEPHAIVTFITTNYYPTAAGAKKLRKDMSERSHLLELINFNELRIFESALGQHNMITILTKSKNHPNVRVLSVQEKGTVSNKNLEDLLSNTGSSTRFANLPESEIYDGLEKYIRFPSVGFDKILGKMAESKRFLIDICNVTTGIQTGADRFSKSLLRKYPSISAEVGEGIFQISFSESEKFVDKSRLKPFYKNSDIKRWIANEAPPSNLIYLRPEDDISEEELEHLSKFKSILEDRWEPNKQGNSPWWMLWRPRRLETFEGEKIICSQRSLNNRFAFTAKPWFASADVYFITTKTDRSKLKTILGLLNSRLYYVWLYHKGKKKGEVLELYQNPLSEIPIPSMTPTQEKEIERCVDLAISSARKSNLEDLAQIERNIDTLVYELFELSIEERGAVDNFWISREFKSIAESAID